MPTRAERIQDRLEDIVHELRKRADRGRFNMDDIMRIKEELHEIDEEYQDACIHERDGSIAPGQVCKVSSSSLIRQAIISELLEEAHSLSSELMEACDSDED
ncbi:hypothetical protein HDU96_005235 [Phlyctochytrium bullatum]|nr:hypothetical protein HDU96_005235 [Phlyctochytrium bullatum]